MLKLDSPAWNQLHDAYGTAEKIPELLRHLYANPLDKLAWQDAWSCLCHQGTIYSASIAAVPHLVSVSIHLLFRDRLNPLFLIGCIVSNLKGSGLEDVIDADFESFVKDALRLLIEVIEHAGLTEDELRYSLSAVAALKGYSELSKRIELMNDEDVQGDLPSHALL